MCNFLKNIINVLILSCFTVTAFSDIVDFSPNCHSLTSGVLGLPKFDGLSETIQRAQSWITMQNVCI